MHHAWWRWAHCGAAADYYSVGSLVWMHTESESDWDLQVSLMPGMKVSAHQVCVWACKRESLWVCVCLGCVVVNHHLCADEGGQVLISILYAHAGGGDTLGNMELEREKVGKIEKKINKRKAKKTTENASGCLKNTKRECDKIRRLVMYPRAYFIADSCMLLRLLIFYRKDSPLRIYSIFSPSRWAKSTIFISLLQSVLCYQQSLLCLIAALYSPTEIMNILRIFHAHC